MTRKTTSTRVAKTRKSPGRVKTPVMESGFPVIAIGASAGGLEAFEVFFRQVPADSGMAFILVSHLDPGHASMLVEILQRITAIPVTEAANQMTVEPDHVYIIPPNREMTSRHSYRSWHLTGPMKKHRPARGSGRISRTGPGAWPSFTIPCTRPKISPTLI